MASPMVEGRIDPHKKAHFTLHLSDRIEDGEVGDYTSVKYNHKPQQPTASRSTTLKPAGPNTYRLRLQDENTANNKDVFIFTGQKTAPKKSYMLLFDASEQKATLEPLASTYTFNLISKNGTDVSSTYPKIYPRKPKEQSEDTISGADGFFDQGPRDDVNDEPDVDNPYDFRHFLKQDGTKRGDESEYNMASSPDYRTGTGSAVNTPQIVARKPASTVTSKAKAATQAAKSKKRPSPDPEPRPQKKTAAKKQAPPTVRLERRATEQKASSAKASRKPAAPPSSKIKSAEIVHSSDDSDIDAEAEPDSPPQAASSPPPRSPTPPRRRSPSPKYHPDSDAAEDEEMEDVGGAFGLEIEVPDARPNKPRHTALQSLGLGQNLGLGYLKSPSNGPISLASAANSVEGSPNPNAFTPRKNKNTTDDRVIEFDTGGPASDDGNDDDVDVEPMDIGPPAHEQADGDGEEDDPLYYQMMQGLAGESSEESEEE